MGLCDEISQLQRRHHTSCQNCNPGESRPNLVAILAIVLAVEYNMLTFNESCVSMGGLGPPSTTISSPIARIWQSHDYN